MEKEMTIKKDMMSTEKSETKLRTEETPFQLQNIAEYMEEQNIMGQTQKKENQGLQKGINQQKLRKKRQK
ncbi:hypothetical protein T06_1412 [Trichinella sp. T6]|nr:hypothetical protein T06_1412 [Trichinella sp. T6]